MKRHDNFTAAVLTVAGLSWMAGLTGCAPQPAPPIRVIQESEIKVGAGGETISTTPAAAPAAEEKK